MHNEMWERLILKRDNFLCQRCGVETTNVIVISAKRNEIESIKNGLTMCSSCENEYVRRLGNSSDWRNLEKYLNEKGKTLRKSIRIVTERQWIDNLIDEKSVIFSQKDLDVKDTAQNYKLRDKLEEVGRELIKFAQMACPNRVWDYYVTSKNDFKTQWAAIFPMKVINHRKYDETLSCYPNIILRIPMDSNDIILALNLEFKLPRELLYSKCSSSQSIEKLMNKISGAKDAIISVKRKLIINNNKVYNWLEELWDDINLPDINTSQCTSKYLSDLPILMRKKDTDRCFEPIFLIKYQIPQAEFFSNPNIIKFLGERVSLLTPIMDCIVK